MFRKLALALAAPLLLLGACATEGEPGAVEVRTGAAAVSALRAAPEAAAEAGTASFEMVMEVTSDGESFELTTQGAFDAEAEQMAMTMDLGGMLEGLAESTGEAIPEGLDGPMEMIVDGTTIYVRAPMFGLVTGEDGWISMRPDDLGTSAGGLGMGLGSFDPSAMLDTLRGVTGEPEVVGTEAIRGVETTHYTATMDVERAIAEAPEAERELLESRLSQLGDADVAVDVWIDTDDLPRRLELDMSEMLASFGMSDEGTVRLSMELFGYGDPVDIELPAADDVTPFGEVMGVGAFRDLGEGEAS